MNIEEYVDNKSRVERTAHINLNTPCQDAYAKRSWKNIKKGDPITKKITGMHHARENLKELLGLSGKTSYVIHSCHLCDHNTKHGGVCVNPHHLYFGTVKENWEDKPEEVRREIASKGAHASNKARRMNNSV